MMRVYEFVAFLGLAGAAHLGAWSIAPQNTGATSSGNGGTQDVSVAVATSAQAQMVAEWQRPPAPNTEIQTAFAAPAAASVGVQPMRSAPMAPRIPTLPNAPAAPAAHALPELDTAPADRPDPRKFSKRPKERTARVEKIAAIAGLSAPSQQVQKARGRAKSAQADQSGKTAVASASKAQTSALRAAWGAQIYRKIRPNMMAPARSKASGAAKLELRVASNGRLQSVTLKRSSGDPNIDKAALRAVSRSGRFARAPKGLDGDVHRFSLSLGVSR